MNDDLAPTRTIRLVLNRNLTIATTTAAVMLALGVAAPSVAATSPAATINAATAAAAKAVLGGSVVEQRFTAELTVTNKLTIMRPDVYRVDNPNRVAISIGELSYENIAIEFPGEPAAQARETYPNAEWYVMSAYPNAVADTISFSFDDVRIAVAAGTNFRSKKQNGLTTYMFTVAGSKLKNEAPWYSVNKKTSASASATVDSKGRLTGFKAVGSGKQGFTTSLKITYGKQNLHAPVASSVITYDQLLTAVPSIAPRIPDGWGRVDVSAACATALEPARALQDEFNSGTRLTDNDLDRLNDALDASHNGCSEEEWNRWYDLEFWGWFQGAVRIDAPSNPFAFNEGFSWVDGSTPKS